MKKISNVLWGLLFIVIGIIWILNVTEIVNINLFFRGWWTLFIIVPSIFGIVEKPKDISGYIFLLIGLMLFALARDLISFVLISKLILPLLLIFIGISILFKNVFSGKISKKINEVDKDGMEIYSATFSDNRVKLSGDEFKNARLDATFGSVTLDLSECNITKDGVITASAIFAGVDIIVPDNVNVKVKSTGIFGGTSNKSKNKNEDERKTIYIESFALFGGAEIK